MDLPFVGISTFAKREYIKNWNNYKADVSIIGAPFDFGTQFRPGARFGPRAVREASTLFSFGHAGAYDHEDKKTCWLAMYTFNPVEGEYFDSNPSSYLGFN